ncbi:MAG: hypothetical protein ABR591_06570 [Candidatus Velthaea sp.]
MKSIAHVQRPLRLQFALLLGEGVHVDLAPDAVKCGNRNCGKRDVQRAAAQQADAVRRLFDLAQHCGR